VVSGGYTEDAYLRALARHSSNRSIDLTLKICPDSPARVVEYARRLAQHDNESFDEIWCLVDVDEFDIQSGAARAAQLEVELLVSNPCFELWLLLHLEPCTGHLAKCKDAERMIRKHVPGYQKPRLSFDHFKAGLVGACKRARDLDDASEAYANPSTGVWRLVERMMERKEDR
jgi:hypothetical protein